MNRSFQDLKGFSIALPILRNQYLLIIKLFNFQDLKIYFIQEML